MPGAQRYLKKKIGGRTVQVHRMVMEGMLGRPLQRDEIVHHRNGDRHDNRPENLELMTARQHSAHHNQKHPLTKPCAVCGTEFAPHPTKRQRAKTCRPECARELMRLAALEREARRRAP